MQWTAVDSHAITLLPSGDALADLLNNAGGVQAQNGRVFLLFARESAAPEVRTLSDGASPRSDTRASASSSRPACLLTRRAHARKHDRAHGVQRRRLDFDQQLARAGLVDRLRADREFALCLLEQERLLLARHGVEYEESGMCEA
jgi:hypothetical protein